MRLLTRFLIFVTVLLLGSRMVAQVHPKVPRGHEEFLSGGATSPDLEKRAPGPRSPIRVARTGLKTGTNQLVVGPNVRVNDPQQAFPNGLLGRSETTVAASGDGELVLVGFNDAQGFCGPPFGSACTPENPPGLSGFGFSLDAASPLQMAAHRTRSFSTMCSPAATRGWTGVDWTTKLSSTATCRWMRPQEQISVSVCTGASSRTEASRFRTCTC